MKKKLLFIATITFLLLSLPLASSYYNYNPSLNSSGNSKFSYNNVNEYKDGIIKPDAYGFNESYRLLFPPPIDSYYMIINESGYYEINNDIINCSSSIGIYIKASNVILDGKGHILDGVLNWSSKIGIYVYNAHNVTIRNFIIQQWMRAGIYIFNATKVQIYNNTLRDMNNDGIVLYVSGWNNIYNNTLENMGDDKIDINFAYWNRIVNNYFYGEGNGMDIDYSAWNTIANNTFVNDGIFLYFSFHNRVENNTVNGKPLVYLEGVKNYVIDYEAGQIILVYCNNITIKNQNISNTDTAIGLWNTNNTKIYNNYVHNNPWPALYLYRSFGNIIFNNTFESNMFGIYFELSSQNIVFNNTIKNNNVGILFWISPNNILFYNNIINNGKQVNTMEGNKWISPFNITYTFAGHEYQSQLGNYWSNYNGTDNNNDGIGEAPMGQDTRPLIKPTWNYEISDKDFDGLNDVDELLYNTNPNDPDTDGDGIPDGWEIKYGFNATDPQDADMDIDNDGLTNLQEYLYSTNPRNPDTDGDGMPDGWEIENDLNPFYNDSTLDPDNDGLTNIEEYIYGTNPHKMDSDNDGYSDGYEIKKGTNPLDPNSHPKTKQNHTLTYILILTLITLTIIGIYNTKRKK